MLTCYRSLKEILKWHLSHKFTNPRNKWRNERPILTITFEHWSNLSPSKLDVISTLPTLMDMLRWYSIKNEIREKQIDKHIVMNIPLVLGVVTPPFEAYPILESSKYKYLGTPRKLNNIPRRSLMTISWMRNFLNKFKARSSIHMVM